MTMPKRKDTLPKLFSMVSCKAYLDTAHDTVHIGLFNADGSYYTGSKFVTDYSVKAIALKLDPETREYVEFADLSGWCGETVEKTYRVRKEAEFSGCVVGYARVKVRGWIGTDWTDSPYGEEHGYFLKCNIEKQKVAVVYYRNNAKRYVPVEDLIPCGEEG